MATKTKLEQAVETQAKELGAAQQELVLSQFATYKWNKRRMSTIEDQVAILDRKMPDDPKMIKAQTAMRKQLMAERHQLATENASIATKLHMQLKDTGEKSDEFDEFFKRS